MVRRGKLPFQTRQEACAAAAAEAGILDDLNDFFRLVLHQALCQRFIAVIGDVFVDVFRVDDAAVAEGDTFLLGVERGVVEGLDHVLSDCLFVEQTFDRTAFEEMLRHDFRDVFSLNAGVERAFRVDNHDRADCAETKAARFDDLNFFSQAVLFQFGFQRVNDLCASGGRASGTAADQYVGTIHIISSFMIRHSRRGCIP